MNEGRTVKVKAELKGNEWVINGNKLWASNAGIADLNCVVCNMDPKKGVGGFTLVYVPEPWEGVSHGEFEVKCGANADRNTPTYFDNVRVPKEWGIQGPEAWFIFTSAVSAPMSLNAANAVGTLQGAFDILVDYTEGRVAGGKPVSRHLHAAMILGEMAAFLSVARAAVLETAYQYDNMNIYGMWNTESMMAKGHAIHAYITRTVPDLVSRGLELMGSFGLVRENGYEKYYRDAVVLKIVLGGSHLGYFETCKQFYDLDYSSFGPGKLQMPT
jgi:alkylation response protein AidB-like acyl-CoA dehydrogenase